MLPSGRRSLMDSANAGVFASNQGRIIHEAGEAEASGLGPRTARYNEHLHSRTTLGPEISREKICGLLKFLPQMGPGPEAWGPAVAFMPQGPDGPWSSRASNSWKHRAHTSPNQLAKFGWRSLVECRAVTLPRRETHWNLQGCLKLANRSLPIVGRGSPYYEHMWKRYCSLTRFSRLSMRALVAKTWPDKVARWCPDGDFFASCIYSEPRAARFRSAF